MANFATRAVAVRFAEACEAVGRSVYIEPIPRGWRVTWY